MQLMDKLKSRLFCEYCGNPTTITVLGSNRGLDISCRHCKVGKTINPNEVINAIK